MRNILPQLLPLALPLFVLLPTACSGGGGDPSGGAATAVPGLHLLVDRAAGSADVIDGRLEIVALERADGSLTPNLLRQGTDLGLAHPDGSTAGIGLLTAPAGTYAAVHLLFADESFRARRASGEQMKIDGPAGNLRLEFTRPFLCSGAGSFFMLRHRRAAPLEPTAGGGLRWRPDLMAEPGDVVELRFARVDVLKVDPAVPSVLGSLVAMGDLRVELFFEPDAILVREPFTEPIGVEEFVAGLVPGARLIVEGFLDTSGEISVSAALDLGIDEPPGKGKKGRKGEVQGTILELFPDRQAFRMSVQTIEKGEDMLPATRPLELTVLAGEAKIKQVPRHGCHRGHLPFSALATGMLVDVEWHGPALEGIVPAHKVDIRTGAHRFYHRVDGVVREVDLEHEVLVVETDAPVRLGGESYESVRVEVTGETLIALASPAGLELIELGGVQVDDRARVLGRYLGENRLAGAAITVMR